MVLVLRDAFGRPRVVGSSQFTKPQTSEMMVAATGVEDRDGFNVVHEAPLSTLMAMQIFLSSRRVDRVQVPGLTEASISQTCPEEVGDGLESGCDRAQVDDSHRSVRLQSPRAESRLQYGPGFAEFSLATSVRSTIPAVAVF